MKAAALVLVLATSASCDTVFGIHAHADAAPLVGDGSPADAFGDAAPVLGPCEARLYGAEEAALSGVTSFGIANDEHLALAIQSGNLLYTDGAAYHQVMIAGGPYLSVGLSSDATALLLGAGSQRDLYAAQLVSPPATWSTPALLGIDGTPGASAAQGERIIIGASNVFTEFVAGSDAPVVAAEYSAADLGHAQALIDSPGLFDEGLALVYLVTGPLETGVWMQTRASVDARFGATGSMLVPGSYRSVTASLGCRSLWLINSNDQLTRFRAQ